MVDKLQAFDYRRSPYERPNQKWVCGRLAEGAPCHIGPDGRGHCRADFACRPAKVDDRWRCARSELAGGKCEQGPLPDGTCCVAIPSCRPRLSWRGRRGAIARWVAAVTVGAVLTIMSGAAGPSFLSPGELTFHHAAIKDCGECHSAFEKSATGWVGLAFQEWPVREDTKRCLGCHRRGGRGQRPHDLSPRELEALTAEAAPASTRATPLALTLAAMAFDRGASENGDQPCGTCHREHRGTGHDLRAMGDVRCMSCHAARFSSLAEGHPEFSGYPFDRRTRLFFDHTSHFAKHFRDRAVKQRAPFSCKACHAPDAEGRTMLTKPFAASCGDCHAEQIAGAGRAGSKGIAVLALPGLDLVGLHEAGAAIGGWPEDADDTLTPFMKLLLAGDDGGADAIAAIEDLDLLDLEQASEAEIDAVEELAWRIKTLFFELTTEGAPALEARLERAFGRPLEASLRSRLVGQLPVDGTRAAALAWFPDLHGEVPRHRAGETVPIPQDGDAADEVPEQAPSTAPGDEDEDEDASILDEDEDDSILDEDEDASILDEDEDASILDEDEDDSILDEDADTDTEDEGAPAIDGGEPPPMVAAEDWSAAGGWYRDDFTLRYRPVGHADPFLKAWLEVSGEGATGTGRAAAAKIFERLSAATASGACGKCHSVDGADDGGLTVNWRAARPLPGKHEFTRFDHRPHFNLPGDDGCLTCHRLDSKADYQAGFKDRDPGVFASNFRAVERTACAKCHTASAAGDGCLRCHNYHLGEFPPVVLGRAALPVLSGPPKTPVEPKN